MTIQRSNVVRFPNTVSAVRIANPDAPSANIQAFTRACRDARIAKRRIGGSIGTAQAGSKSEPIAALAAGIGFRIGKVVTVPSVRVTVRSRVREWLRNKFYSDRLFY